MSSFRFRFDPAYRAAALLFGVMPATASVVVEGDELRARFGPWRVRTPLSNIAGTEVSGPYSFVKTAGPAHLSFTDRGVTFATNGERGLCIRFREPVRALDPTGRLRHPGLTVTVDDVEGLAAALAS
ncbi:MAG TPA: hypothetical protein VFJ17_12910 [Mycobacteriales bacterium]|jgi:hypothetical protein|nr:hypothetical protein [Mycobacteriales bacterium]